MHRTYLRGTVALSIVLIASSAAGQLAGQPLPETSQSTVGHETVAEALKALRSQRGVVFTTENGWLIATDEAAYTIWSFAPQGYPAYPAAVKRQVVPHGNASIIQMNVLCEATKEACDDLVRTFAEMNGLPLDQ
jgi:hypothetical protein